MPAFNHLSDYELAALLRTEGESVFRVIYERYWEKLYVMAKKRLNDPLDAEEIVQDIFCNFWRKRSTLTLSKGFDNYFAVAVKYEVINRLAKRSVATKFVQETAMELSEIDETTLQQLDYNELLRQLELTINGLSEKCRIVFRLKQEEGYSQRQIAEELDISEKTVEAHLSKARKTLRNAFGNVLGLLLF
jgi:RNA polymerase sigma-70 factor (family 1)